MRTLFRLILVIGLVLLMVALARGGFALFMSYLLNNSQAGVPNFSSTQVSGFSFPTARPPGQVGDGLMVGNISLYVTGVQRPADEWVGNTASFTSLKDGEEYLRVDIFVNCRSTNESCRVSENDFGVRSVAGRDYSAEFSTMFSNLDGLFKGGEIAAGANMSGSLIFTIHKDDNGLRLFYPRFFGFGSNSAEFILGP
jgi:hypothetical protein